MLLAAIQPAYSQVAAMLHSLYEDRRWPELRAAVKNTKGNALYKGALSVVFNEDSKRSEQLLRAVISSSPGSQDAYEAYEWLCHVYLREGQYRQMMAIMDDRWSKFPDKEVRQQERAALSAFRGLPNQVVVKAKPAVLPHEDGSIFIPLSVNGTPAEYFFDTGAGISAISESEAKRLGLPIGDKVGTMGTTTVAAAFRTTVARDVVIGGIQYRNVSFAVFPDDQEPWSQLRSGRKGIIGIQLILRFGTLRWIRDGDLEISGKSGPPNVAESNLRFEDDHLVLEATVKQQKLAATLDTGATNTDLFEGFAKQFAPTIAGLGKSESIELKGIGGGEILDAINLPDLMFRIGGRDAVLTPARVLPTKRWHRCCAANIGMDLLKQAFAFKIDFGAMKLELEGLR